MKRISGIFLILLGFAFGEDPNVKMKVEEPGISQSTPQAQSEQDAEHAEHQDLQQGLTTDQLKAMEERKQKTRELAELIREKRKAIREADPETKQKLTEDFEKMLLDKKKEKNSSEAGNSESKIRGNRNQEKQTEKNEEHSKGMKPLQNESMQKWHEYKQLELERNRETVNTTKYTEQKENWNRDNGILEK